MAKKPETPKAVSDNIVQDPKYQRLVDTIDREVDYVGSKPYSHNIIGIALGEAAKIYGKAVANDLIEEFELERLGWIKVNDEDDI